MAACTRGGIGVGPAVMRYCLMKGLAPGMGGNLSGAPGLPGTGSELGLDPVHHRAQLRALALDLVLGLLLAHALEVLLPGAVLGDPLAGERPVLDLAEDLAH